MFNKLRVLRSFLISIGQIEGAEKIDQMIQPTAVVVTGNPKYIENNVDAERFYSEIVSHLKSKGFSVRIDSGEPFTSPPKADLWVGHSMGADRLSDSVPEYTRFAVAFGVPNPELFSNMGDSYFSINHPGDTPAPGQEPAEEHYIFTNEMKQIIDNIADSLNLYQEEHDSTFTHAGEEYDLNILLRLTSDSPIEEFLVSDLEWILEYSEPDSDRVTRANLSAPVLVTKWKGKLTVIDGLHRLVKAVDQRVSTLPGKLVSEESLIESKIKSTI